MFVRVLFCTKKTLFWQTEHLIAALRLLFSLRFLNRLQWDPQPAALLLCPPSSHQDGRCIETVNAIYFLFYKSVREASHYQKKHYITEPPNHLGIFIRSRQNSKNILDGVISLMIGKAKQHTLSIPPTVLMPPLRDFECPLFLRARINMIKDLKVELTLVSLPTP